METEEAAAAATNAELGKSRSGPRPQQQPPCAHGSGAPRSALQRVPPPRAARPCQRASERATGRRAGWQPRAPLAAAPQTPPAARATTPGHGGEAGRARVRRPGTRSARSRRRRHLRLRRARYSTIHERAGALLHQQPRSAAAPHGSCSPAPRGSYSRRHCLWSVLGDVVLPRRSAAAILVPPLLCRVSPRCPRVREIPLSRAMVLPGAMFGLLCLFRGICFIFGEA